MDRKTRIETVCARIADAPVSQNSPLAASPQLSAVYRVSSLDQIDALYEGREAGFIYARDGHPSAAHVAAKIAEIEGAEAAVACSSGMGAESAVLLALLQSGDHVAIADGVYGRTAALVGRELARFAIEHSTFDATDVRSLERVFRANTRVVFAETLSNPLLRFADLPGLARAARAAGAILVVDHTFAPLLCRPLELGADLVVHSVTKLIGGHSDLTLGAVAGSKELVQRCAAAAATFGFNASPFDCWLALRGIATLAVRSKTACATALDLARKLAADPRVLAVHYPGLPAHADHDRAARELSGGFGTIVTIDAGDRARADALIRALDSIPFAPSLGDVTTTLSHPATTSHRGQTPEQWARQGISPGLIRLSVGLEDCGDLWAEIDRALPPR